MASITYIKAIILGLVQGLAEFLPISSSGHLALLQHFFGVNGDSALLFTVLLHVGTLVSVFICYWSDIVGLARELVFTVVDIVKGRGPRISSNPERKLLFLILVATIPTGIIGIVFKDAFESLYTNIIAIGCGLIFTGIILKVADKMGNGKKQEMRTNYRNAIFTGIMQGIAIAPGISRSGSTLFGSLFTGLERSFAVRFAFLISIPSILGSLVLELPDAVKAGTAGMAMGPIIVGMIVAAVSGFVAIKWMIRIVTSKRLSGFSYYVWALGAFVIIWGLTH